MRFHIDVDWQVPSSIKYALFIGLPVLVMVGGGAIVYAGVPNTYSAGQVVSATAINQNFTARLAAGSNETLSTTASGQVNPTTTQMLWQSSSSVVTTDSSG